MRLLPIGLALLLTVTGCSRSSSLPTRTMPTLPASSEKAVEGTGFSVVPAPGWKQGPGNAITQFVLMSPKKSGDFNNNLNVLTQADPGGVDKYREETLKGMKQIKATILDESKTTVDGHDAYRVVYKANLMGKDLKFCSTGVPFNNKVYLVTGTALEPEYDGLEPAFDQMTYSLKIK